MPIDYARVGAALRHAREQQDITQAEIARRLGMTGSNVSRIESGAVTSIENIERYAHIVGCSVAVVFAEPGDRLGLLAARLAAAVQHMDLEADASLLDTLESWAVMWEQRERRSNVSSR